MPGGLRAEVRCERLSGGRVEITGGSDACCVVVSCVTDGSSGAAAGSGGCSVGSGVPKKLNGSSVASSV